MSFTEIKISADTENRLNRVREELDSCSQSSSFDEVLVDLIDLAEENESADFNLPESLTLTEVNE